MLPVSSEFKTAANLALDNIYQSIDLVKQSSMHDIEFIVRRMPTPQDYAATGVSTEQNLLGLFSPQPPMTVLFEEPIRYMAHTEGTSLEQATQRVLEHEIFQHAFGVNHVLIEKATRAKPMAIRPCT
jgi:hypothetical protein